MPEAKLPLFPVFVSLAAHHQEVVEKILNGHPPSSDYNFISLWSWDHQNKLRLSILNGNLVVRFQDYLNPQDFFYSFLGTSQPDSTAKTLLEHSAKDGQPQLKLIPEFVINGFSKPDDFLIEEDRDSFDYIVAIKDMLDFDSYVSASKKWSMRHFASRYSQQQVVAELDIKDSRHAQKMLKIVETWRQQKNHLNPYNEHELAALRKLLSQQSHVNSDNLHVLGIYIGDELKAFSITEILNNKWAIGHYKKHDRDYRGLGAAMEYETAKSLQSKGVTHLNHEQDLGIEGLRTSKMAYQPITFLRKYTISLKD